MLNCECLILNENHLESLQKDMEDEFFNYFRRCKR
jgi:hypothetical protein